jgi:hypothetical protein
LSGSGVPLVDRRLGDLWIVQQCCFHGTDFRSGAGCKCRTQKCEAIRKGRRWTSTILTRFQKSFSAFTHPCRRLINRFILSLSQWLNVCPNRQTERNVSQIRLELSSFGAERYSFGMGRHKRTKASSCSCPNPDRPAGNTKVTRSRRARHSLPMGRSNFRCDSFQAGGSRKTLGNQMRQRTHWRGTYEAWGASLRKFSIGELGTRFPFLFLSASQVSPQCELTHGGQDYSTKNGAMVL